MVFSATRWLLEDHANRVIVIIIKRWAQLIGAIVWPASVWNVDPTRQATDANNAAPVSTEMRSKDLA